MSQALATYRRLQPLEVEAYEVTTEIVMSPSRGRTTYHVVSRMWQRLGCRDATPWVCDCGAENCEHVEVVRSELPARERPSRAVLIGCLRELLRVTRKDYDVPDDLVVERVTDMIVQLQANQGPAVLPT